MCSLATDDTIARLDNLTDTNITGQVDGSLLSYIGATTKWQVTPHISAPLGVLTTDNQANIGGGTISGTPVAGALYHLGGIVSAGGSTVGNARGSKANDLQVDRASATQVASGNNATIGGGQNNTASGNMSTVPGGTGNIASGTFSQASGANASATLLGEESRSSGAFTVGADCQVSRLQARNITTLSAAFTELFLNGSSSRLTLAVSRAFAYDIIIFAAKTSATAFGEAYSWRAAGVLRRTAAGSVVLANDTVASQGTPLTGMDVQITADTTNQSLKIEVKGTASTSWKWTAYITIVELG